MPVAAPRWCPHCQAPHPAGQECPVGRAARLVEIDRRRPGPRQRLYTAEWDRERALYLKLYPTCEVCGAPATEVHHRIAHRGDPTLFWNLSNWCSLCKRHHSAATMRELADRRISR